MADVIDKELAKRVGMNITNLLILNGKTQKEMCDHFNGTFVHFVIHSPILRTCKKPRKALYFDDLRQFGAFLI